MQWVLKSGNILDEPADVLVCSANCSLNLSGGVGSDLLGRYGSAMQQALHAHLAARTPHVVYRGEVIPYSGSELPFKAVLHAVAVDGFYQSSPAIIEQVVRKALQMAAEHYRARKVTLTALATGFGNLSLAEFAAGLRPILGASFSPIEEVCVCLYEDYRIKQLAEALPEARVVD